MGYAATTGLCWFCVQTVHSQHCCTVAQVAVPMDGPPLGLQKAAISGVTISCPMMSHTIIPGGTWLAEHGSGGGAAPRLQVLGQGQGGVCPIPIHMVYRLPLPSSVGEPSHQMWIRIRVQQFFRDVHQTVQSIDLHLLFLCCGKHKLPWVQTTWGCSNKWGWRRGACSGVGRWAYWSGGCRWAGVCLSWHPVFSRFDTVPIDGIVPSKPFCCGKRLQKSA